MAKNKALKHSSEPFLSRYCYLLFAAALIISIFFCLYGLGDMQARDWDESRHGVSAYEMLKSGDMMVNTYQYNPDFYNLKPPLSFWSIALCYKIFGFNLFAMRFYSAFSFCLSVAAIFAFCLKRYGKAHAALCSLLLSCCAPFYEYHFARHADADAQFALFSVLCILSVLLAEDYKWAFPACSLSFAFAFLAKSWHAMYLPPVVFIIMLIKKLFFKLKASQWAAFVFCGAAPIAAWTAARYSRDGIAFFQKMIQYDLLDRTSSVLEGHYGPFYVYIVQLFTSSPVIGLLLVCSALLYLLSKDSKTDSSDDSNTDNFTNDIYSLLVWLLLPLLMFSIAKTKLSWYVLPIIYPAIIISSGLLIKLICKIKMNHFSYAAIAVAACVFLFSLCQTYIKITQPIIDPLLYVITNASEQLDNTEGDTVYFNIDSSNTIGRGTQKYVLTGELLYDWNVKFGSPEAFNKDDSASLLVTDYMLGMFEQPENVEKLFSVNKFHFYIRK